MNHSNLTLQSIPGAADPLFIQSIGVDWACMFQKSPFPSMPNTIWILFTIDADTPAGTEITVNGFMNMQTADDLYLPCTSWPNSSEFQPLCRWNQSQGSLTFISNDYGLLKGKRYQINVTLVNPRTTLSQTAFSFGGRFFTRAILEVPLRKFSNVFVPPGPLLGINSISGLAAATPGAVVSVEECRNMSKLRGVVQALQVCMTRSGLQAAVTACMETCNSSVLPAQWSPDHVWCCALKCLDNCWDRRLVAVRGGSADVTTSAAWSSAQANSTWVVSLRRLLNVSWQKRPWSFDLADESSDLSTFSFEEEGESAVGVTISVTLLKGCMSPLMPWLCQPWWAAENEASLNGTLYVPLDPATTSAVFTDLVLHGSVCRQPFQLAFYANNFTVDSMGPGYTAGSLAWPRFLSTQSWPVEVIDLPMNC